MGWRERFGADDERARIAARARALLDAAGTRPSPGEASSESAGGHGAAPVAPLPPPRGGWVPPTPPDSLPGGRHAVDDPPPAALPPVLVPVEPDDPAGEPTPAGRSSWRERVRFDPGRRGLVAIAAVVVVVGSVAGGVMVRAGGSPAVTLAAASGTVAPSEATDAPVVGSTHGSTSAARPSPSGPTGSGSPDATTGTVTVDVAGLVVHPGVYTLPGGSRVEDALHAAGGAEPGADLATLNRARVLVDGEQLAVGVPGAAAPAAAPGGGAAGTAVAIGAPVDLNTATLTDLDALPGVGPVLAQKILDWRTEHGRFASVDDLQQVSGIGPTRFADLRDLVTV